MCGAVFHAANGGRREMAPLQKEGESKRRRMNGTCRQMGLPIIELFRHENNSRDFTSHRVIHLSSGILDLSSGILDYPSSVILDIFNRESSACVGRYFMPPTEVAMRWRRYKRRERVSEEG